MALDGLGNLIPSLQTFYTDKKSMWDATRGMTTTEMQQLLTDKTNALFTTYNVVEDVTPSGRRLGLSIPEPIVVQSPGDDIIPDSNIPGGTYGGGNTATGHIPATVSQDGGQVRFDAGSKATGASVGQVVATVADRVSLAVAGVNIGAKLGKAIDSTFYDILPGEWQDKLWALNPETWSTLVGQSAVGDFFLRSLFGITGQNQMTGYISEDVFAYYYQMMRENGFWSTGDTTVIPPEYGGSYQQVYGAVKLLGSVPARIEIISGFYDYGGAMGGGEYCVITELVNDYSFDVIGREPFTAYWYLIDKSTSQIVSTYNQVAQRYDTYISNTPAYVAHLSTVRKTNIADGDRIALIPQSSWVVSTYTNSWIPNTNLVTTVYDGTIETIPAKPGVSDLTGATQYPPTNITGTTTADVLQELKQQYPDLFSDAITETVMQDDGTEEEVTYVPIPWVYPDIDAETPTTTEGTGQDTTAIGDETLTQIMPFSTPDTPTDTPPTGEGTTPEVVPPTGSASSLWAIYNPTQGELNSFGAWLWSSSFVEQIKKLFADPMQAIIGVHKVFVNPPTSGSATIKCGYLDSGVSAAVVSNQYTTLNCGSANVREYFGNVFDYDPHTKISLFLPFIGIVPLNVADVMRGTVSVKYTVDVITGACLAEVSVSRDGAGGILYTYGGSCIVSYPVSSGSYAGVISAAISTAIGVGLGLASGGASLPISLGMVARGALNAKTQVQHSGQFSGAAGVMGGKKPYLIVSRPQTRVAANVEDYAGMPSNATIRIGDCVGFTKLSDVHLIATNAYDNEIAEIETALKEGVII